MTDHERGLYGKFGVTRIDGRDQPGGDKEGAAYFVLDFVHDPFAPAALRAYAAACRLEYPALATDLQLIAKAIVDEPPVAPSVDVEKLDALAYRLIAGNTSGLGGLTLSEIMRMIGSEIRALLDSTPSVTPGHPVKAGAGYDCGCGECLHRRTVPSVDYGPAETQYGVREPGGLVRETGSHGHREAEKVAQASRRLYATAEYEAVACEQRRTPWRPVDGAPEEALCDCRHIGSDHNDEGRGLVPCQRCDCPDYSPVDGAPGEEGHRG